VRNHPILNCPPVGEKRIVEVEEHYGDHVTILARGG
jgi:hypothetical protein